MSAVCELEKLAFSSLFHQAWIIIASCASASFRHTWIIVSCASLFRQTWMDCHCIMCLFFLLPDMDSRLKRSIIPASHNFICHFLQAVLKGLTFGLCLYVLHLYNVHVLYCIPGGRTCIRFELVKSSDVTLCG